MRKICICDGIYWPDISRRFVILHLTRDPPVILLILVLQIGLSSLAVTAVWGYIDVGADRSHVIPDAQGGYFGTLIGAKCVLTQESYTNVDHNEGDAGRGHPDVGVVVQLDHDPGARYGRADAGHYDGGAAPVFRGETFVPLEFGILANLVFVVAHFATQRFVGGGTTFHKPSSKTLMVYTRNISSTIAGLYQGLSLVPVVANPALPFVQERLVVFTTCCRFSTVNL